MAGRASGAGRASDGGTGFHLSAPGAVWDSAQESKAGTPSPEVHA